ncbi:MAG TPA: hypothetical protein VNN22_03040 [Verrucomicrobiae bacterium]|nr:hypothetical protein [Verrucomicrobiae bacterium]
MPTSIAGLKKRSNELFDSSLATVVNARIDAAVQAHSPTETNAAFSLATFGLADDFYASLGIGKFTGLPTVRWNNMDDFMFIPDSASPFSYTTSKGDVIQPRLMETDGGSIPRILRGFKNFSSWGYAPGFIIHDWIFTAHKCSHTPDNKFGFGDSATILAECMKTLMEVGYTNFDGQTVRLETAKDTLYVIYLAVDSSIAKKLWDTPGSVVCYPKTAAANPSR